MKRILLFALAALPLLALPGCPDDPGLVGGCLDDAQCVRENGQGWVCSDRFNPKRCECTGDAACGQNEFCNAAGACQPHVGCYTNDECPVDQFCDSQTTQCIQENKCVSDLHCPIGSLCNTLYYQCEPGCRVNGDCPLRQVCRCPETDPECDIGQCQSDLCEDESYCLYKEYCELDPELGDTVCVEAAGPYCDPCQRGAGSGLTLCEEPGNYCLVDTSVPGGRGSYCGVKCQQETDCPNGFGCHFVVILTQSLCGSDADCTPTGASCASDDECPGGRCDIPSGATSGQCAGRCIGHEGGASGTGFCSCVQDADCPQDTCDTQSRVCGLTRAPCQLEGDQCRGQLSCVNIDGVGGCVIGKNCAPDEGISCAMVRTQ